MASVKKHMWGAFAFCLLSLGALLTGNERAAAQGGTRVDNIATVSFTLDNSEFSIQTNIASFEIAAVEEDDAGGESTASEIEFFRFAEGSADGIITQINGSEFSPSGALDGPFTPVGSPVTIGGNILDLSGDVTLVEADRFLAGELIFVRVIDAGQNVDPGVIDSLVITIDADGGDTITLRLFESGPAAGEFVGFVPSSRAQTDPNDSVLTTPGDTGLTARYVDSFDASEVSVDTALVDPFGRVFESASGTLIDGATVTIVDADTGAPADVFGVDGVSVYPSTIITGSVVTDTSGLEYELSEGEFLFPLMRPGFYRLEIEPPDELIFPSVVQSVQLTDLPNGPFEIIDGSFGGIFEVLATGPLNFDVPLDDDGELTLIKSASVQTTAIGDFVGYTIQAENSAPIPHDLFIRDNLPPGFRLEEGTARLNGEPVEAPLVSAAGESLLFTLGTIAADEIFTLTYVARVGAGAPLGEAVNEAFAVDVEGARFSNRTEASVFVQEDLLRSRLTIVGQVVEGACSLEQEWARDLEDGFGVPGVRLYLETGDYIVSDEDGLYHFENVRPGTHVVQVDEATLPPGYEAVLCEENSRYADSATSKFVDTIGGAIWRANFYLERTSDVEVEDEVEDFNDHLEHLEFDQGWIDAQEPGVKWIYPATDRTPSSQSVNLGIQHEGSQQIVLMLNGSPVPSVNFAGTDGSLDGRVSLSRFRGVDIAPGRNEFVATVFDLEGKVVETLKKEIWFVTEVEQVGIIDDQSILVADGRSFPTIALRVTDAAGRPVHSGRQINVDIAAPYALRANRQFEDDAPITAQFSNLGGVTVGSDGIARVQLEPTLQTGLVRLQVRLADGTQYPLSTYLKPEKREWIIVGLAEGEGGLEFAEGPGAFTAEDLVDDGRVAFFAKGTVRGDWLLTLAVDTARRRGDADGALFEGDIDPNAFYTLYGDRTFQDREAESRFPFFVKLEKNTFQLLFGDYDTDLGDTVLGRYTRRLSGLRAVRETEKTSFTAFAADTNQGFARDELAADGTSGPYQLSTTPLLRNSERIFIETRDRFRPDQIVSTLNLTRFVDYDIDFDTGEVIFRRPVDATDDGFNPNVIVAEYETAEIVDRSITAGGRAAGRLFDGNLEVGATYIRETGDNVSSDAVSQLAAVDLTAFLGRNTEIRAEYAYTNRDSVAEAVDSSEDADALLFEVIHRQEALLFTAFYREDESGFGLGQQSSGTIGVRRFGAAASYEIGRAQNTGDQLGSRHFIDAEFVQETNLETGDERRIVDAALRREGVLLDGSLGVRYVEEDFAALGDDERRSTLLTSSLRKSFPKWGLSLNAAHEQPIGGEEDESSLFPQRTILGVDKTLTEKAILNVRHEILDGENASGNNTTVGVSVRPWIGTELSATTDLVTQDSSRRLSATVGVDQTFRINDVWSASVGAARRANISGNDIALDVAPDDPISPLDTAPQSPLTLNDSFTSAYTGVAYRKEGTVLSSRLEVRDSTVGTRYAGILGGARETSETLSFALAGRVEQTLVVNGPDRQNADVRLGASWRPRGEGPIVYNRFDVSHTEVTDQLKTWRVINNVGVNALVTKRTQLAAFYGVKYTRSNFVGDSFDEVTHLVGGDVRHDITRRLDVGFSGSALITQSGEQDFQYGPNIGVSPAENVWITLGYNFEGFNDRDFEAAEFSRKGPFIKFRIKFDQHTAKGLLRRISPQIQQED
ncbi:MAG: hypothetical protein AAF950_16525 [Pseudomonadota bacterium]